MMSLTLMANLPPASFTLAVTTFLEIYFDRGDRRRQQLQNGVNNTSSNLTSLSKKKPVVNIDEHYCLNIFN
jgi:hypothetical protein